MVTKFSVIFILLLTFACGSDKKKDTIKGLQDEVIAIHDEVMPRMGELQKLKMKISITSDSISKLGLEDSLQCLNHIAALDSANKLMMDWMHQYKLDLSGYSSDEAIGYLKNEKEKIALVKDAMNSAITNAAEFNLP